MSVHSYNVRHRSTLRLSELLTIPDMFPYKKPSLFRSQAAKPNLRKSPEMIRCFLALDFTVNSFIHVLHAWMITQRFFDIRFSHHSAFIKR